jgi:hypothetical protein
MSTACKAIRMQLSIRRARSCITRDRARSSSICLRQAEPRRIEHPSRRSRNSNLPKNPPQLLCRYNARPSTRTVLLYARLDDGRYASQIDSTAQRHKQTVTRGLLSDMPFHIPLGASHTVTRSPPYTETITSTTSNRKRDRSRLNRRTGQSAVSLAHQTLWHSSCRKDRSGQSHLAAMLPYAQHP